MTPEIYNAYCDIDFGMHDPLRGQRLKHSVGNKLIIFGCAEAFSHSLEGHKETMKIRVPIECPCLR